MIDYIMEPVVQAWVDMGLGFCDADRTYLINHAIWADNLYILSSSWSMWRRMVADLTNAQLRAPTYKSPPHALDDMAEEVAPTYSGRR